MKLKMYCAYDSVSCAHQTPVCMLNRGVAVRAYINDLKRGKESQYYENAADWTFFEIGEYDDSTGLCIPYEKKENIGNALDLISKGKNDEL